MTQRRTITMRFQVHSDVVTVSILDARSAPEREALETKCTTNEA